MCLRSMYIFKTDVCKCLEGTHLDSQDCFYVWCVCTIVWEKFDVKKFLSLVWHDENWTHEIFLTMNKKVTFLFIGDSKGRKYFTMNNFHTKISNGEFFPNYGTSHMLVCDCACGCARVCMHECMDVCIHVWVHGCVYLSVSSVCPSLSSEVVILISSCIASMTCKGSWLDHLCDYNNYTDKDRMFVVSANTCCCCQYKNELLDT